jgi:hypothetical protein
LLCGHRTGEFVACVCVCGVCVHNVGESKTLLELRLAHFSCLFVVVKVLIVDSHAVYSVSVHSPFFCVSRRLVVPAILLITLCGVHFLLLACPSFFSCLNNRFFFLSFSALSTQMLVADPCCIFSSRSPHLPSPSSSSPHPFTTDLLANQ